MSGTRALQKYHEFLAAPASRGRTGALKGVGHYPREQLQHIITHIVTVGVVDCLEIIRIQHYQRDRIVVLRKCFDYAALYLGAVEKPGQAVMRGHLFKLAVGLSKLLGGRFDKRSQTVYHGHLARKQLVLHVEGGAGVFQLLALAVGRNNKSDVVLVHRVARPQELTRGVKTGGGGYRLEGHGLLADLAAPEGVAGGAGVYVYHFRLTAGKLLSAEAHLMEYRPGVAVGNTRLNVLLHIGGHRKGAVGVAGYGCTEYVHPLVLVEEGEL